MITLLVCLSSCQLEQDSVEDGKSLDNIKSITTRFVSHQSDTQVKDSKVVTIADFNPDGTVEQVVQHMTYPYNFKEPKERHIWTQPDPINLPHIMDGLDFGIADNNFLYGNDWPVKYARIDPSVHPKALSRGLEGGLEVDVTYESGEWPKEIQVIEKFKSFVDGNETDGFTFYETFTNDGRFITGYRDGAIPPERFRKAMLEAEKEYAKKHSQTSKEVLKEKRLAKEAVPKEPNVHFYYANDLLDRVEFMSKTRMFKFFYDETNQLIRSEFYVKDRMYNSRHYFYNSKGLKTKTEIYNVDGEAEYTINYEYEFFNQGES